MNVNKWTKEPLLFFLDEEGGNLVIITEVEGNRRVLNHHIWRDSSIMMVHYWQTIQQIQFFFNPPNKKWSAIRSFYILSNVENSPTVIILHAINVPLFFPIPAFKSLSLQFKSLSLSPVQISLTLCKIAAMKSSMEVSENRFLQTLSTSSLRSLLPKSKHKSFSFRTKPKSNSENADPNTQLCDSLPEPPIIKQSLPQPILSKEVAKSDSQNGLPMPPERDPAVKVY